jgi:hypothetical protein
MGKFAKPRKQNTSCSLSFFVCVPLPRLSSLTNRHGKTFILLFILTLCFCFLLVVSGERTNLFAQNKPRNPDLEQLLEFFAINSGVSPNLDAIEYFALYPINLRTATARDLIGLAAFPQETAENIITFIRSRTSSSLAAITFAQLQTALNLSDIQTLILKVCTRLEEKRLVSVDTTLPAFHAWYRARTRFWAVPQRGFTPDATPSQQYQGSALELYQRLTVRYDAPSCGFFPEGVYEANITAAKDAGERTITDFLSGYLRAKVGNTHIVAGDFLVESGMGTTLWSIYGNRKSADVLTPTTQQQFRIIPYRSSTEQQYFRGLAAQSLFRLPRNAERDSLSLNLKAWYSSQSRAARIDTVLGVATSLNLDGLFRTRSEISLLGGLQERIGGIGAEIADTYWSVGATAFGIFYDKPIVSRSVQVFFGQSGINASVYGSYRWNNLLLSGELSRDAANNIGGRINTEFETQNWHIAASLRTFPTEFRAPFGVNFGENTKPSNEAGLYMGAVWRGIEHFCVTSYLDVYTTHSSTATVPVPVRGVDIFSEATWNISPELTTILRARHETKTDALTQGTGRNRERIVFGRGKTSLRLHAQYDVFPEFRLQSRVEGVLINSEQAKPVETGVLGFIGVQWKPLPSIAATMRFVGFRTDSFDSALWQYEQTVAGTLSNPPLYGQGIRAYCLVEADILPIWSLSVRGSLTRRFDVTTLGSGSTLINSNTDAQLLIQTDVRF